MTTYPFVDNNYGTSAKDYGDESPVIFDTNRQTVSGGHFNTPKIPSKPGFSKSTELFRQRLLDVINRDESDDTEHIDAADIPDGLLYAFEAIDADPQGNEENLSGASPTIIKTPHGHAVSVVIDVSPNTVIPDPLNGRVLFQTKGRRLGSTFDLVGQSEIGIPIIEVQGASELINLLDDARKEIGITGLPGTAIKEQRDEIDLISVGLHGVTEELLVIPMIFQNATSESATMFVAVDGSRRLELAKRVQVEATELPPEQIMMGFDHLTASGSPTLRDYDHDAIVSIRRGMQFDDPRGGTWLPVGNARNEEALSAFATTRVASDIKMRSVARTRKLRARVLLGVIPSSLSPEASQAPSPLFTIAHAKVQQLHIEGASQKPWSKSAQSFMAAQDVVKRVQVALSENSHIVTPTTSDELEAVVERRTKIWMPGDNQNSPNTELHPVRLVPKVMATFSCNGTDTYQAVTEGLKHYRIPTKGRNIRENRAQTGAALAQSLVFPAGTKQAEIDRVTTSYVKAFQSPVFADVEHHPNGVIDQWYLHLNDSVDQLVNGAKQELADHIARAVEDGPTRWFGPNGRCLAAMAVVAMTSNPIVRLGGNNQCQLTQTGLGGSRGVTTVTPEVVMCNLLQQDEWINQLGEIVNAALEPTLRIPVNVIDGSGDPLTEKFVRGTEVGWPPRGAVVDAGEPTPELTLEERYEKIWTEVKTSVLQARDRLSELTDANRRDPSMRPTETLPGLFSAFGYTIDDEVMEALSSLQRDLVRADTIARQGEAL